MKLAFHPSKNATTLLTVLLAKTKRAARIRRRRWDVLTIILNVTATDVSALLTSATENTTATMNLTNSRLIALKTNLFAATCAPVIISPATWNHLNFEEVRSQSSRLTVWMFIHFPHFVNQVRLWIKRQVCWRWGRMLDFSVVLVSWNSSTRLGGLNVRIRFQCKGGPCIDLNYVCGRHSDCPDGTDEGRQ